MAWISKKAKAQIRSRRRKQEKSKNKASNQNTSSGREEEEDLSLKRKRDDGSSLNINNQEQNQQLHNEGKALSIPGSGDSHRYDHTVQNDATETNVKGGVTSNWEHIQKDTVVSITIPSTLSSKATKKLRKDTRRKARKGGRDEKLIKFVDENGVPLLSSIEQEAGDGDQGANSDVGKDGGDADEKGYENQNENDEEKQKVHKKRKMAKKTFPRINQLLAEAEAEKKEQKEKDKRKSYEDSIPTEVKAQYVALDCEMVGIGAEGKQSALARVSITDWCGEIILDTFVQVPDRVTDFRTFVSGVRAKDIRITNSNSMELHACRKQVGEIIKNKILVGHSLKNDFAALMLGHPKHLIRDTARYKPFMRASGRNGGKLRPRKLRDLVKEQVGLTIQKDGEAHTSVEDAKATMELYKVVRGQWEKEVEKLEASKTGKKRR